MLTNAFLNISVHCVSVFIVLLFIQVYLQDMPDMSTAHNSLKTNC